MQRKRRNLLGVMGLAAAVALLVHILLRSDNEPVEPQAENLLASPVGASLQSTPAPAAPSDAARLAADSRETIEFFQSINRYPAGTRRLSDQSHDLLNPGARHENRQRLPNDPDSPDPTWEVLYTADRYFINGEETALISLELWHDDEPIAPSFVSMVAESGASSGDASRHRLAVRRDAAGTTVSFAPDTFWPERSGPIRVTASFAADGLMNQTGTLDFYFTGSKRIPAQFTGAVSDRLLQGNLAFDVGLDVQQAGRYRIEANLFDALGRPFGWARYDGEMMPGEQAATLLFDGLLFHDAQAPGPYLLTEVRGYRLDPQSPAGRELITPLAKDFVSRSDYRLADFRDTVQISPRQQRLLEMYQDAERRGVVFTNPQYKGQ
jgi:hypothetical protein